MPSMLSSPKYQEVLDAAAWLQVRRSQLLADLERGRGQELVRLIGQGPNLNQTMMTEAKRWKHLLSVRQVTTAADLRASMPNNRRLLARGLKMTSLFDLAATTPAARGLLAQEDPGVYFLTRAPLQCKIIDQREVLMEGPSTGGDEPSVIAVSEPGIFAGAMRYWQAVQKHAVPAWTETGPLDAFTPRQRLVLDLMRQDMTDQAIADLVGVSLRTVRYEVAAIMDHLGVKSRFSIGAVVGPADS